MGKNNITFLTIYHPAKKIARALPVSMEDVYKTRTVRRNIKK